jgi:hypothetical protein
MGGIDAVLFAGFAAAHAVLLGWGVVLVRRHGLRPSADVVLLVAAALIYDNAVLAAGGLIGEGTPLETLSAGRYLLHALLTPLLVVFALDAAARAGLRAARTRTAGRLTAVLYLGLVAVELGTHVVGLVLHPRRQYGVLSYAAEETASGPPLMVLGVSAVLLVAAAVVWWKQRWPWFLVGVVLMTVGGAVPLPLGSAAVTNAFELVLLTALLATKHHQDGAGGGRAQR